jgi:hypothetical protein
LNVTLELYTVIRAAEGDEVVRWAVCHDDLPLPMYFETRDEAAQTCRSWGWTIVEPTTVEER